MPGKVRIGLSGWSYKGWRGDFYPDDLPQNQELTFAAERFPTLEINRTFYSLVKPKTMRAWYEATPYDLRFSVKGSRFVTHNKKLANTEDPMRRFVESGLADLKHKHTNHPMIRFLRRRRGEALLRNSAYYGPRPGNARRRPGYFVGNSAQTVFPPSISLTPHCSASMSTM